jgi:hydroxyacylglutathione hydrolase
VIGPTADAARIPGLDVPAAGGDELSLGASPFRVLHVPGHTRGHCAFYFPAARAAFVGDTLFSLGCGRMFEGTPEQFWGSLCALAALPDDTALYCAHEYTSSNARFALTLEPGNAALAARAAEVAAARAEGRPTVPSTLASEKACNRFLRPHSAELRAALGLGADASDVDVFAATRRRKDTF